MLLLATLAVAGCGEIGGREQPSLAEIPDGNDTAEAEPGDPEQASEPPLPEPWTEDRPQAVLPPTRLPPASEPGPDDGASPAEPPAEPVAHATMTTSGRRLLDSCGNPFVVRGVEQIFAEQLPQGNDWVALVQQIAGSGVNAVRVLANTDTLDVQDVDALLDVVRQQNLVAYITPYGSENIGWLERQDVRAMLTKHEKYILIDAFSEPTFDDRARFVTESMDTLRRVRSWGYRVPLTVTANQYGRDLPSVLELGAQIVAADPLGNTILGWQAYWGSEGYYQERYGFSLTEAVQAVANAPFPVQLGLDRITDYPSTETADFGTLLAETAANGIGWLWWDWYNPYGIENNLTTNGSSTSLTPTGQTVLSSHAASVEKTARRACAVGN